MTHTSRRPASALAWLLMLLAGAAARPAAADNRWIDSLEWAAADADAIVRARIARHTFHVESAADERIMWGTIDLTIIESIKGPLAGTVSAADWNDQPWVRLNGMTGWSSSDEELLVFLDRRTRFGDGPGMPDKLEWVVRKHGGWFATHNASVIVSVAHGGMYGMWDNRRLVMGRELLDRVRAVSAWAATQPAVAGHVVGHSREAFEPAWRGPDLEQGIWVPVGEPFFKQARDALAGAPDQDHKAWALAYLARQPGAETRAAVRGMFGDGSKLSYRWRERQPGDSWSGRHYPIRGVAYDLLRRWGESPDRPVVDAPADWHEPAGRTLIGIGLLALAWPVAWLAGGRRNAARPGAFTALALWCLLIGVGLTVAWAASYRWAWSVAWEWRGQRWQAASHRGTIRVVRESKPGSAAGLRPVGVLGGVFRRAAADADEWDLRAFPPTDGWAKFGGAFGAYSPNIWGSPNDDTWIGLLPWWWPVALVNLPVVPWAASRVRRAAVRRGRRRRGCCLACGYDTRATPGRCPECGRGPGA